MAQAPRIDRLLNLVPDSPNEVLEQLRQFPQLASQQDSHGYSLIHAAASYGHADLLKALVKDFHVNINIKDEDDETALFNVEAIDMAQALLDLGIDADLRNDQGQTAAEKLDDEDEQPQVAAFLKSTLGSASTASTNGQMSSDDATSLQSIPPLPKGVDISIGTMPASDEGEAPDPEIRRRIEELAAQEDFQSDARQQELRDLISQVVSDITNGDQNPTSRRRLD